jgi:hypothetical protein
MSANYPVKILAEYFGRNQVSSGLFAMAKEYNTLAFAKDFRAPNLLTDAMKSTLFVFLDFLALERKVFIERSTVLPEQPSLLQPMVEKH